MKTGLDDFLVARGADALRELMDKAKAAPEAPKFGPMDLAKVFLSDKGTGPQGDRIRHYRDSFYAHFRNRYQAVSDGEMFANVLMHGDEIGFNHPTMAEQAVKCLRGLTYVPSHIELPAVLGGSTGIQHPLRTIVFANGLVDFGGSLTNATLLPHTSEFFSTSIRGFKFDPHAECPRWMAFLTDIFDGDKERIRLLQQWFGYLTMPDTSLQKFLLIVGPPRAGKSVILAILTEIVGRDSVASPQLMSLGREFGLSALLDKSVAICPDAHLSSRDSMPVLEVIKSIVGEDSVNVNRKNREILTGIRLPIRFVVTVNELPDFRDASGALNHRVSLLRFTKSYAGRENTNLRAELAAELSGIFLWSLAGRQDLDGAGSFIVPRTSEDMLADYSAQTSPVRAFLDEATCPGEHVACSDVYAAYCGWCDLAGRKPVSEASLGRQISACHPAADRKRRRTGTKLAYFYTGIRLSDSGTELLSDWTARRGSGARS